MKQQYRVERQRADLVSRSIIEIERSVKPLAYELTAVQMLNGINTHLQDEDLDTVIDALLVAYLPY